MDKFPHKKTYLHDILDSKSNKLCSISYNQATIQEFDEFQAMDMQEQIDTVYTLLEKSIPKNLFQRIIKKLYPSYTTKLERRVFSLKALWEICNSVMENKFRTYTSKFTKQKKNNRKSLYSVSVSSLCKEYNISWPQELIAKYTLEQYMWMLDGIIYMNNEQTKEGRAMNDWSVADRESAKKDAKATREAFERAAKLKQSKKK